MMKDRQGLVASIPLGRFGTVDEMAQAVMSLIGNAYMTGQTTALSGRNRVQLINSRGRCP